MTSERNIGSFLRRVLRINANDHRDGIDGNTDNAGNTIVPPSASAESRAANARTVEPQKEVMFDASTKPSISISRQSQNSPKPDTKLDSSNSTLTVTSNAPHNNPDTASVMTIASSSKRRRRSLDTNASTRALAAESILSSTDSTNE